MSTRSVAKANKGWAAARTRYSNLAKKVADPTRKIGHTALAAAGGATAGYVAKYARESGRDITIGDSRITYTAAAGVALALGGAVMGAKKGMSEASYAAHGLGTGIVAGELAMLIAGPSV